MMRQKDSEMCGGNTQRVAYLDLLRVVATFAVVLLHTASDHWYHYDPLSAEWQALNFYDSLVRWSVPVFVMITGALLLEKACPIEKIFKKYILRVVVAFVFWSSAYVAYAFFRDGGFHTYLIVNLLKGHYHLWYLFMIAGLYLIVPFLKKITEDKHLTYYFLTLSFVFAYLIPQATAVIGLVNETGYDVAKTIMGNVAFTFACGYSGYFLLGYVLSHTEVQKKSAVLFGVLGLAGFAATAAGTAALCMYSGWKNTLFYDYLTVNVLMESIGIFLLFRSSVRMKESAAHMVAQVSQYCFGVYLMHPLIMMLLRDLLGIQAGICNMWVSVPAVALVTFALSMLGSWLCSKIPVLNRLIV